MPQDLIAFFDAADDDPESQNIVYLINREVLVQHLFIDTVKMFVSAFYGSLDLELFKFF